MCGAGNRHLRFHSVGGPREQNLSENFLGVALKELCGIFGLFETIRMSRCNHFEVSGPDIKPTSSGGDLLWCVSCRKYHSV